MKKEYNFSHSKKNPYAKHFKKQISIRIDLETINYFKKLAEETDISYQNLINLFLKECAVSEKKLRLKWTDEE